MYRRDINILRQIFGDGKLMIQMNSTRTSTLIEQNKKKHDSKKELDKCLKNILKKQAHILLFLFRMEMLP